MSQSTGIRSAVYFVTDLALARAWYTDIFGVEPYFDEPFYVGFRIGSSELGLDPDDQAGTPGPGGVIAYWGVADVAAALARVILRVANEGAFHGVGHRARLMDQRRAGLQRLDEQVGDDLIMGAAEDGPVRRPADPRSISAELSTPERSR